MHVNWLFELWMFFVIWLFEACVFVKHWFSRLLISMEVGDSVYRDAVNLLVPDVVKVEERAAHYGEFSYCSVKASYVRGRTELPGQMRVVPVFRWNIIRGNQWLRFFIMIKGRRYQKVIFKETTRGSRRHFFLRFAHLGRQGWSKGLRAGRMASGWSNHNLLRRLSTSSNCDARLRLQRAHNFIRVWQSTPNCATQPQWPQLATQPRQCVGYDNRKSSGPSMQPPITGAIHRISNFDALN